MVVEEEYLQPHQTYICSILATISGSTSIGACLLLIVLYTIYGEYKTFHLRLIYVQTWLDLFLAITYVVGANTREHLINEVGGEIECNIEGGFLQLTALASCLWTGALAHTILLVLGYKDDLVRRFEVPYHLIVWGFSLTSVLILLLANGFGDAGLWCWISGRQRAVWFRFGLYYIPCLLVLCWNVACYMLAAQRIKQENATSVAVHHSGYYMASQTTPIHPVGSVRIFSSFRTFVFVYFLVWVIGFSNRVVHAIQPTHAVFWLYIAQAIAEPSLGLLNVLAYGITDEVFRKARRSLRRWRNRSKKHQALLSQGSESIQVPLPPHVADSTGVLGAEEARLIKPPKRGSNNEWYESFMHEYDEAPSPPTARTPHAHPGSSLEEYGSFSNTGIEHLRNSYLSTGR